MATWVTHRVDIPKWLATSIGRLMAEQSDLEWQFEEVIRILLETDIKRGRMVAVGMNLRGQIKLASNLILCHGATKSFAKTLDAIAKEAEKLKTFRDRLAHGAWGKIGPDWYVLSASGARSLGGNTVSRAYLPSREKMTRRLVASHLRRVRTCRRNMRSLRASLRAALPPSPYRSPEQHHQSRPRRTRP